MITAEALASKGSLSQGCFEIEPDFFAITSLNELQMTLQPISPRPLSPSRLAKGTTLTVTKYKDTYYWYNTQTSMTATGPKRQG